MGAHDSRIDHHVLVVGIAGQVIQDARENAALGRSAEAPVGILPIAKPLRQIAPEAVARRFFSPPRAMLKEGVSDYATSPSTRAPNSVTHQKEAPLTAGLASCPASMVNQNFNAGGIPLRFKSPGKCSRLCAGRRVFRRPRGPSCPRCRQSPVPPCAP